MTKRKTYTKEFKLDAIALVQEQNYNITEAARNLGLSIGRINALFLNI